MNIVDCITGRLVADWKNAHRWWSIRIPSTGAFLFAIATGLSMSGAATQWLSIIPLWAVFLLGLTICVLTVWGRLWRQNLQPDHDNSEHA